MRIPGMIMDGVVFLYPTVEHAEAHAKLGGTGFLIGKRVYRDGKPTPISIPYLVTNKHVAAGCSVLRLNRRDGGKPDIYELDERFWVVHPDGDDVAVIPLLGILNTIRHRATCGHIEAFITEERFAEFQIGVGEQVCMIGRFVNHQGRRNGDSLSAARFGSISVMPQPIYNKACLKDQLSFAVEMRSRTGFSGSPVLVYRTPATILTHELKVDNFWGLLGVNWGYIYDEDGENTWLNAVAPAWKIIDVMNTPKLSKFHQQAEEQIPDDLINGSGAEPAVYTPAEVSTAQATDNSSHKEDFTRLLGAAARANKPVS